MSNYKIKNTFWSILALMFFAAACTKDDASSSKIVLLSFGPSGVQHGDKVKFIGQNLDKVTSIVLPPAIEIPSSQFATNTSTMLEVVVPDDAQAGKVTLKTPQGDIETKTMLNFLVPVTITSITPTTVKPGNNISIKGTFVDWITSVTFNSGVKVTDFVSKANGEVVVTVPAAAKTGSLIFNTGGTKPLSFASADPLVITLPAFTSFGSASLRQADNLTINGTDLDLVTEVDFAGGAQVRSFVSQTATKLVVAVPNTAVTGTLTLMPASQVKITTTAITVIEPAVTAAIPKVRPGDQVTITGTDLDLVKSILFPNNAGAGITVTAPFVSQSATSITVATPALSVPGNLKFTTTHDFSVTISSQAFNVTQPSATNYSGSTPGTDLTITGTDLDLVGSILFPNSGTGVSVAAAAFKSQSATSIVVTIPAGVGSGTLKFTALSGYVSSIPLAFGGACVTNFPGNTWLHSFDSNTEGFGAGTYLAPAGMTTTWINTDGHSCLGAAKEVIPFSSYGTNGDIEYNANMDWTGKTKLHFWVKLSVSGGATNAVNALQFFVNSNGYSSYGSSNVSITKTLPDGGTYADGNWHEGVLDLVAISGNFVATLVQQYGVQVQLQGSAPGGGPATPPTVTLLVDDVWLE